MEKEISILNQFWSKAEGAKLQKRFSRTPIDALGEIEGVIGVSRHGTELTFRVVLPKNFPLSGALFYSQGTVVARHLLQDGLVCMETPFTTSFEEKLTQDYYALVQWIDCYVVKKDTSHYEYLPLPRIGQFLIFDEEPRSALPLYGSTGEFMLTPLPGQDRGGNLLNHTYLADFLADREATWSPAMKGVYDDIRMALMKGVVASGFLTGRFTFPQFETMRQLKKGDKWPIDLPQPEFTQEEIKHIEIGSRPAKGVYCFLDHEPITADGNPLTTVKELWALLPDHTQAFILDRMTTFEFQLTVPQNIPLALGYQLPGGEIHWEWALIPQNIEKAILTDQLVLWCKSINGARSRFFGRGMLHDGFISSRILIIGTGAIGSSLAETLVRGGTDRIDLVDPEAVEMGNICRSTFSLSNVHSTKAMALAQSLLQISPFVEVKFAPGSIMPCFRHQREFDDTKKWLSQYHIIFDCTAVDSVAWMLDELKLDATIINLSITDEANHFVAITNQGKEPVLPQKRQVFAGLGQENKSPTFYEGTGCWHPTFRASYADINLLLQHYIADADHRLRIGKTWTNLILERIKGDFGIRVTKREEV